MKPRVQWAALRYEGTVVTGPCHALCDLDLLVDAEGIDAIGRAEEGFVLSDGTFVSRSEAAKIAAESEQLRDPESGPSWGHLAISEDIVGLWESDPRTAQYYAPEND